MMKSPPLLGFVVPCFNEAEGIDTTIATLSRVLTEYENKGLVAPGSFALYVDDGSEDGTWEHIVKGHTQNSSCCGIKLSANTGHQYALLAGMLHARKEVDCVVTLDADLQHDVASVETMLLHFSKGSEIVYGVRKDRGHDSWIKRTTGALFYKTMALLKVNLIPQHADFRLVGKNALNALEDFTERNIFLRGIFPSMGFRHSTVLYDQLDRTFGQSKFSFRRMMSFAWQGITSFSSAPLRIAGLLSICTFFLALLESARAFIDWCQGNVVPGWSSLIIAVLFLGAVQLFSLAVIGEYLAKLFIEVKRRPRYIIEESLDSGNRTENDSDSVPFADGKSL